MSRRPQRTRAEAWKELREQLDAGKPAPQNKPTHLSLRQIKRWPEVFQHRNPGKNTSDGHVRSLRSSVKQQGELHPLLVWWDGKGWACVDGHHRLEAYRSSGKASGIPVEVFTGTPEEALREAASRNTRDKLPMSTREKVEAAWHLVAFDGGISKAETVKATGAGDGTVAKMRRVKKQMEDRNQDCGEFTWEQAQRWARGLQGAPEAWDDTELQQRAQKMASGLQKVFGREAGHKNVDVLALALELYDTRLPEALREHWGPLEDDNADNEESEI